MTCNSCKSENVRTFPAEITLHFPELKEIKRPHVLVNPEVLVCMDCGVAQFAVPDDKLKALLPLS